MGKTTNRRTLLPMVLFCACTALSAQAQNVSLSVRQNDANISALGTAVHSLSGNSLKIEAKNGKVVVSNSNGTVASVPCTNGGQLLVASTSGESTATLTATVGNLGYGTLYSPFQLTVPEGSDVEVYAPTLVDGKLMLTDDTRLAAGTVISPETGIVLKNQGSISFALTGNASSSAVSALSGSSLTIDAPVADGYTLCTLGRAASDNSLIGFFKYTGSSVAAGKAYLLLNTAQSALAYSPFSFGGDHVTGIVNATSASSVQSGKRLENGRIVIVKNGHKYSPAGIRLD